MFFVLFPISNNQKKKKKMLYFVDCTIPKLKSNV